MTNIITGQHIASADVKIYRPQVEKLSQKLCIDSWTVDMVRLPSLDRPAAMADGHVFFLDGRGDDPDIPATPCALGEALGNLMAPDQHQAVEVSLCNDVVIIRRYDEDRDVSWHFEVPLKRYRGALKEACKLGVRH